MHEKRSPRASSTAADSRELITMDPGAAVREHVLGYRGFRFGARQPRCRLLVPDGVVKVMFGFGEPVRIADAVDPRQSVTGTSMINGLRATATLGEHTGQLTGVTVMLTPIGAFRLFGLPMAELAERNLDPADLLGQEAGRLICRLAECRDWTSRFALLDEVFAARLLTGPECAREVVWMWQGLRRTGGRMRVGELAAETGWSRRRLERRFREQVGLPPKQFAQVLRLQEALRLQDGGLPWAEAAALAGYYDQAHFTRAFKDRVGCTPGRFGTRRASSTPGDPLDFLPDQVTSVLLAE
ncbi:AraC family transcriptional regulator [Streptomyces violaceusniger]|uniref:helix-turn-helix domain-containing protein n=1 Tax=Streptomyces violaceusniger TaxID=68280 RepID=UPI0009973E46|nr:AraC family transcriptional regulator [Streptomyces hygroscopicus]AQW55695.1 AraC family transcriptional regulator [Streptomyces hygroscopicus]